MTSPAPGSDMLLTPPGGYQDVLGGNCSTMFIATLNSASTNRASSGATVRHVRMLQRIQNFPMLVDDSLHALLRRHRLKVAQLAEEVGALRSGGGGGGGGKGVSKEEMGQHLLAIHELEGRVISANMEKVRLGEEREKLLAQFQALRSKYTELAASKAELQQAMISSEEDR